MRSLRLRQGLREAGQGLREAASLARNNLAATLLLGLVLAVLPALLRAGLFISAQEALLADWEIWAGAIAAEDLTPLLNATMQGTGLVSLSSNLLDLATSLILSPVLLSALALLYNGYVHAKGPSAALEAAKRAGGNAKNLVVVALLCMLAEWFVQMVPSIASGLLSAVAGILSFIPLIGPIASVLAVVLSLLVSVLTDFAVTVIFCYVWICASCEGISGFGALVRSWQHTRNAMHETISTLLVLSLLRWLVIILLAILWLFVGLGLSIPLTALLYTVYAVNALHTVALGGVTTALYLRRPSSTWGPPPGSFSSGPDLSRMKSANIDEKR